MSTIFILLLLSFCTSSSVCSAVDDEGTLLKIKEQLGNPSALSSWVPGTASFCPRISSIESPSYPLSCSSSGRVVYLQLDYLGTNAPFPDAICDLTELQKLTLLIIPNLFGPIPCCINKLFNLQDLVISDTSLSGPIPNFLNHQNLKSIVLVNNQLSGSIPPSLSTIPNLNFLHLAGNHLTGTIPPALVHGPKAALYLYNNNLTGELPKSYEWVDFSALSLAGNRLTGDASFLFSHGTIVHNYSWFDLSNNEFEFDLSYATIPQSLMYLDLSHNKIWGKLPDSVADVPSLDVSYNKLCGEIPQGGYKHEAYRFVNNTCLCGEPLPPCSPAESAPAMAPL